MIRSDIKGTLKRRQDLKRLSDLRGWFARFEIDDEAQANACRARKFILPQPSDFAGGSNDVADLGCGVCTFEHDIYRSGKLVVGFLIFSGDDRFTKPHHICQKKAVVFV